MSIHYLNKLLWRPLEYECLAEDDFGLRLLRTSNGRFCLHDHRNRELTQVSEVHAHAFVLKHEGAERLAAVFPELDEA